jgi:L-asparaginase type I
MGHSVNKLSKSSKPHICLIYTGGTIGMVRRLRGNEWILTPPTDSDEFLRLLKAEDEIRDIADVDFVPLMNKDSTNMVPDDWTSMAKAIHARLENGYDGFVIAHGTDTMHFSASALAFAFGRNLNLPIVFTGAQATPDVPYGDARVNLLRALKVASQNLAEVVVAFGEFVFRGSRVQKKDEKRFDAFESPAEFPLGYITEDIILSDFAEPRKTQPAPLDFRPGFADGIVQFSLIPGLRPHVLFPILDDPKCQGIVLQSFGAGNVPNAGEFSFKAFIQRAKDKNKPVIIASQFPANSTLASYYEPGIEAVNAGAIPTGNMTNAAATVKFRWVLDQILEGIESRKIKKNEKLDWVREMMNTEFVKEITISRQEREKQELKNN